MDDHRILDLFFGRQESAIDETKRKYGQRLHRTAMNILHSNEDAEECVNDTLFQAWEAIPPSRPTSFGAYLAKIARNLSLNKWAAGRTDKRGGGEMSLLLDELEECLPAPGGGPEQVHEAALLQDTINACLYTVETTARVTFVLRYFHGESIREISDRFQMSESKVKSMLFRTRKKLRAHLEKEGVVL